MLLAVLVPTPDAAVAKQLSLLLPVAAVALPNSGWEDGTLPFLSIASLKHGFAQLQALGGMQVGAAV
jgi:hypothetical protein